MTYDADAICMETCIGPVVLRFARHRFRLLRLDLAPAADETGEITASAVLPDELESVCSLIRGFFRHIPIDPPWPILSLDHLTVLEQKVLYETAKIPYGTQQSYKMLAHSIDRPASWRFVGSALGK
ncbi:MAG: MGMT family protein, partial [Desulfosalsimonadaceae bacterium]